MIKVKEKIVLDEKGRKVLVILDAKDYKRLLNYIEDIEDVIAYDKAKLTKSKVVPFEQAVKEIETKYETKF
jgi:hypothetical protein